MKINMNKFVKVFSRLGSGLLLIVVIWGCGAIPALKEGTESNYVRLPFVRILLDNGTDEMLITSGTPFSIECMKGDKSYIYHASHPVKATIKNGLISVSMNRSKIGEGFDNVIISPRGNRGFLGYKNRRYRGMFKILPRGSNMQLINIAHMDDYLKGVVPPEIGFSGEKELEAIKAQAVAARTYSMSHLLQYPDEPYDMKADVSDQVYLGIEVEKDNINRAVDETRGFVIRHRGQLISAYYHSTCGGYTDDIAEVWDKADAPYLRAVHDSGYCSWSKYYGWKESYTGKQLKLMIEQYLSSMRGRQISIGDITDIYVRAKTPGGRISDLAVKTAQGKYTFGKDKIRWVIKRSSNPELILQSARFKIETDHDSKGRLIRADFSGGGYGHGVGMCQCGAIGMARKGWEFADILTYYYKNTDISKLY